MADFLFYGIVEDRQDPLFLGRCKVRIAGVHTDNLSELPTSDLPWATPIQSITSAATSGIGHSPTGLVEGSMVVVIFADPDKQIPLILGTLAGVPSADINVDKIDSFDHIQAELAIIPPASAPQPIAVNTKDGLQIIEPPYIGPLTKTQITNLISSLGIKSSSAEDSFKTNYTSLCKGIPGVDSAPAEKLAGLLSAAYLNGINDTVKYVTTGIDASSCADSYKRGYITILGQPTVEVPTASNISANAIDKNKSNTNASISKYEVNPTQHIVSKQGFTDPNHIYPLKDHIDEPDTPRLATGIKINRTIVGNKEASVIKNIPVANSAVTWNQSPVPYNAKYPHNHATVTESGHVMEFDDTPGAERINLHHKAGTFIEIDNQGNETNKIVGTRTIIVEKDELVYVKGSGHVCIVGDLSVRVGGAAQIEIFGDANLKIHGNYNQEIFGNYNLNVHGLTNINSGGAAAFKAQTFNLTASNWSIASDPFDGHTYVIGDVITGIPSISSLQNYSPNIQTPSPISRIDAMLVSLEDTPEAKIIAATGTAPVAKSEPDITKPLPLATVTGLCGFTQLDNNTQLTTNFKIKDLCKDGPFPFDGQHGKTGEELACNAKQLALNIIEPLFEKYSSLGIKIDSCIRPAKNGSQHEYGYAVDIGFSTIRGMSDDRAKYYALAQEIRDMVPVDQLLLEYRSNGNVWIHISYAPVLRRNILTMSDDKTYAQGLVLLEQV